MRMRRFLLGVVMLLQLTNLTGSMNACASDDFLSGLFNLILDPLNLTGRASKVVAGAEKHIIEPFKTEISPPDISAANRKNLARGLTSEYLAQYGSAKGPRLLLKVAQIQPGIMRAMKRQYWKDPEALWSTTLFLASYAVPAAIELVSRQMANFEVESKRWHLKNPEGALLILDPHVKNRKASIPHCLLICLVQLPHQTADVWL